MKLNRTLFFFFLNLVRDSDDMKPNKSQTKSYSKNESVRQLIPINVNQMVLEVTCVTSKHKTKKICAHKNNARTQRNKPACNDLFLFILHISAVLLSMN